MNCKLDKFDFRLKRKHEVLEKHIRICGELKREIKAIEEQKRDFCFGLMTNREVR